MKPTQTTVKLASFFAISLSLLTGVVAQDRSNEEQEAQISDPNEECAPYYWAGSADHLSSFPTIWEPASILSTDTAAQDKWNEIKDKIPNIPPKGTHNGDFSGVNYPADDPDCWWTAHQCVTPKLAGLPPDISSVPEPLTVGYGFDDGPNCSHNAFYDYLQENNQKATMFFIGSNVMDWPLEAQRAVVEGHEICVRKYDLPFHRNVGIDATVKIPGHTITMQAIKLVAGVTPTCWRPPFGDTDDRIRAIANALGMTTITWQYDSDDWQVAAGKATPEQVDQNYMDFINAAKTGKFDTEGGIILTHELNNFTMSEAVKFYPQLKEAFKYIVPVGVAMNKTQPYVETNYTLPTFEEYISGTITKDPGSAPESTSSTTSNARASATPSGSAGKSNSSQSSSSHAANNGSSSNNLSISLLQTLLSVASLLIGTALL
ncbi:hypothetical protein VNI00_008026 [Paramarasmius palmivorus]|uniref:chitin deacetylase n=1 Tax=Paramarasmius palmivorus TaxID=297713 RepID=A0AAW0CZ04_9AGAR